MNLRPRSFFRAIATFAFVSIAANLIWHVGAQQKNEPQKSQDDEVVRVSSNLVTLDAIVRDKHGKPITDLKAEDFTVTENGVPQTITFFDSTLSSPEVARVSTTSTAPAVTVTQKPTGLPRNIICLVLDGQTTEASHLKAVRDGMVRYINERITNTDSVALFAISGGLQLLQPFTHDKAKLINAVEAAEGISTGSKTAELQGLTSDIDKLRAEHFPDANTPITVAAGGSAAAEAMIAQRVMEQYIQIRSALNVQQTRPVLASLAAISQGLQPIPGKKTLVMFSQGFVAPQALDWQVQTTIDAANRANVSIYIIDSSGLIGGAPTSGALVPGTALNSISAATSQESRIRSGAGESVFDVSRNEGLNRQQDLLYRISGDTGGQFIKNTNDIKSGLERVDNEVRTRYTLAYRSTNPEFDGSFRKIKVEVHRPGLSVLTRQGYYANPPDQLIALTPEERKLMAGFDDSVSHSTLPVAFELASFRSARGSYIIPLSFEIPPSAIEFDQKGTARRMQLNVLGVVREGNDKKILSRLGGDFDVNLTPEQFDAISKDKVFYRQDLQLEPGKYSVELMVRDKLSGKSAAKRVELDLPIAGEEFSTSDPVLSRHAEKAAPAQGISDALNDGNIQIRPSAAREFRTSDDLIVYFKLYNPTLSTDNGKSLVRVTLTVLKDGTPVTRPQDYVLMESISQPLPTLTFARYVKLAALAKGNYTIRIESRDIVQKKVLKSEVPFSIVD